MKWFVAAALLSACAPGAEGPKLQTAEIPKSAEVYLDGVSAGKTPMMVVLDRKKQHHIEFQQAGYRGVSCTLEPGGESEGGSRDWVLLDVMSGFMPGIADVSAHCIIHTRKSTCVPSYLRPAQ